MFSLALLALTSIFLALFLTPLSRNLFRRLNIVDSPDTHRKFHTGHIARGGGVPLMASYLGALSLLLFTNLSGADVLTAGLPIAYNIFPAALLVFTVGLLDDICNLKAWQKFAGQALAAYIAFWAGLQLNHIAGVHLPEWASLPVTLIWLIGCSNAFNLIDGVDGLAAGAGLFATVTMLLGALLSNNLPLAIATVPLAGALLGFLKYNFNPASIFLGDSGSLTLGFLLGCFGLLWGQKSATVLGMTAPLMALAVPLLDTAIAITRRFLRQQPIMSADAAHIHHRLLARGLNPRRVALLLYAACGIAACLSLLSSVAHEQFKGLIIIVFCLATWIGIQYLGYVEFGVAGRMFVGGAFRGHLNNQIALQSFQQTLATATTLTGRWSAICDAAQHFGFTRVELLMHGHRLDHIIDPPTHDTPTWHLDIPLHTHGHLRLTRTFNHPTPPTVLAQIAETLHKNLAAPPVTTTPTIYPQPYQLPTPREQQAAATNTPY